MIRACAKVRLFNLLLLLVRIGLAYYFIVKGWQKLMAGPDMWLWLGQQMSNLGINFLPKVWGFGAFCAEFFGAILLFLGYRVRIATILMSFVMFVAIVMHFTNGDPLTIALIPVYFLLLLLILFFTGAGTYSLDYWMQKKQVEEIE